MGCLNVGMGEARSNGENEVGCLSWLCMEPRAEGVRLC